MTKRERDNEIRELLELTNVGINTMLGSGDAYIRLQRCHRLLKDLDETNRRKRSNRSLSHLLNKEFEALDDARLN